LESASCAVAIVRSKDGNSGYGVPEFHAMMQVRKDSTEITPKQEHANIALVNEPNIAKAAESIKVTQRTLYRWLNDPVFTAAYRKARREAFTQAVSLAQRYTPMAINTLAKLCSDTATPAHARVSACTAILKFGREGIEIDDLAARIETLEQAAKIVPNKSTTPWASQAA
jgi:hypothetical protein